MELHTNSVDVPNGAALTAATITVTDSTGAVATIYDTTGAAKANPFTSDARTGMYSFKAANGTYTVSIAKTGIEATSYVVTLFDPADNDGTNGNLSDALQLADYAALRAYAGNRKSVYITGYLASAAPSGIAGMFVRDDSDTTSADNGGTIIVATNGKRWKRQVGGEVFVTWFGAKGDAVTDDTAAIQAAANYCATFTAYDVGRGAPTLVLPQMGKQGYLVSAGITVKAGIPVEMRNSTILYGGVINIPVLTIGEASTRSFRNRLVGLDVRRLTNITRNDPNDIGIVLINQFFSEIEIRGARDFYIGARCQGVNPGEGFYYNRVSLGFFFGNAINLELLGGDGVNAGWCNENLFIGGEWQGSFATTYHRYGVKITNSPAGSILNDNNVFLKPSFEMNGAAGVESIPFLVEHSHALRVISGRHEGTQGTVFARILNNSRNTDFHIGHQQTTETAIDDQSLEKSTTLQCQKINWSYHGREIYVSESLGVMAAAYNATRYHIPGLSFYRQVDTTLINNSGPLSANPSGNKIQIGATDAVARMIDTSRCKKFAVAVDSDDGQHPWVVIQCFDAAGAPLVSDGAYVSGPNFTWSTSWKGYACASSLAIEKLFTVTDAVKSVRVGFYNGHMRGFSIHAIGVHNQMAATYSGYEDMVPGANIGTQAPSMGTYKAGRVVYNAAPAAGGFVGWVCTVAGSPGTWKTFGAISA